MNDCKGERLLVDSNMQCRAKAILDIRDICVSCSMESLSGAGFVQRVSTILDKFLLDSIDAMVREDEARI